MSKRRELVRAQAALNERVAELVAHMDRISPSPLSPNYTGGGREVIGNGPLRTFIADLRRDFAEWERVRSDLEGAGVEGKRDTSRAAGLPNQGTLRRLVLDLFVSNFIQFNAGMTTDMVEARTQRQHQSISARVHELERAGLLVDSGNRAKTRSNSTATVYVPSERAMELVRNQHAREAT